MSEHEHMRQSFVERVDTIPQPREYAGEQTGATDARARRVVIVATPGR